MNLSAWKTVGVAALASVFVVGCGRTDREVGPPALNPAPIQETTSTPKPAPKPAPIARAARSQIGKTLYYDPAYVGLSYPGGDVPLDRGVCTDVVIRALRDALDLDLQKQVHEDMARAFSKYPTIWGLKRPDKNIDHRRVPNLMTYFKREGYALPATRSAADYRSDDIVTCSVGNRPHIMIVSDRRAPDGTPHVIHNIGSGTREENRLFAFPITGHYRIRR